jgi:hypothetical protein
MHITVNGINPPRTNIMHFSKDSKDYATPGSRMPAIYLAANSTTLVFAIAKEAFNLTALPVGKETFLAIKCYDGNRVRVSYTTKKRYLFLSLQQPAFRDMPNSVWVTHGKSPLM